MLPLIRDQSGSRADEPRAGGPGQSTEDVKWLDDRLGEFFADD